MPSGFSVRPQKWDNVIDLYDDGNYPAIWGNYDGSERRCLGVRWNGGEECGYPNQGGNALWYVEPDFLTKPIHFSLLDRIVSNPSYQEPHQHSQNILMALAESSP